MKKQLLIFFLLVSTGHGFCQQIRKAVLNIKQDDIKKIRSVSELLNLPAGCSVKVFTIAMRINKRVSVFEKIPGDTLAGKNDWIRHANAAGAGEYLQVEVFGYTCSGIKPNWYAIEIIK